MCVCRDQSSVHRLDLYDDRRSSAAAQHPDRVGKPLKGGAVVGARGISKTEAGIIIAVPPLGTLSGHGATTRIRP
eukprot:4706034-Prymnesium_polylepis.1